MELNSEISAIVAGGASGLGRATAGALAAAGCKVAIFEFNSISHESHLFGLLRREKHSLALNS